MKIILILLILNLLLNRKPSNYLYCGLFGWVGNNASGFNRHAFSVLGIANEGRGGDSCGVYYDNNVLYGTGFSKDFPTFVKKIPPIKAGKDCVVLGHTRKASVGFASPSNAQPVVLKDHEGDLGFILTHNGTLTNHEELAKQYDLKIDNLKTDSQILAAMMYYTEAGFDVLGKYHGAATIVFHYPGTNIIYIFKGESRSASNFKHTSEERPLYGYQDKKNSFYYSSLKDPLEVIARKKDAIFDMKTNVLYRIDGGRVEESLDISRANCYQRYVKPAVHHVHNAHDYSGYNDAEYYGYGAAWGSRSKERSLVPVDNIDYHSPHMPIYDENFASMGSQMINFNRGRYHLGDKLALGKICVNEYGLVVKPEVYKKRYYTLYFWEGILLNSMIAFQEITALYKVMKHVRIDSPELLEASPYPVAAYGKEAGDYKLYKMDHQLDMVWSFDGKFSPVFCNKSYQIKDGLVVKTTNNSVINKLKSSNIGQLTN